MNKKILIIIFTILIIGGLTAGAISLFPYNPVAPPQADDIGFTEEGISDVVNANNKFAFDFYAKISENNSSDNLFFSPYSISSAFAMVYEGAKEDTKTEIQEVFNFPEPELLRPNFAAIYNTVNKKNKNYVLRTGNALWIENSFPILEDYTNRVSNYYGGKSVNLDFIGDTENSRLTINDFISEQTNNKINDLIKPGAITPLTRLVLTNAIYFEGEWKVAFKKLKTKDKEFHTDTGEPINVAMMVLGSKEIENSEHHFKYADLETLQILEFPYKDDLSMILVLPTEDIASLGEINLETYLSWKDEMNTKRHVIKDIQFPKFEFETNYSLNSYLKDMGMPLAFSDSSANFSGISTEQVFISDAIHKAYIKVDEQGTTAAAATAIMMGATSMGPPTYRSNFVADHPFLFLIEENETGNILFLGEVNNPSS